MRVATEPYLVAYSQEMAEELGLDPAEVTKPDFAKVFTGNAPIPGSHSPTYAMRYGGHQFGSWAGMQSSNSHTVLLLYLQRRLAYCHFVQFACLQSPE